MGARIHGAAACQRRSCARGGAAAEPAAADPGAAGAGRCSRGCANGGSAGAPWHELCIMCLSCTASIEAHGTSWLLLLVLCLPQLHSQDSYWAHGEQLCPGCSATYTL